MFFLWVRIPPSAEIAKPWKQANIRMEWSFLRFFFYDKYHHMMINIMPEMR